MVEGTLALSIPALILTCNQYFVRLQLGRKLRERLWLMSLGTTMD
jgi:hypothetical protein